MAERNGSGSYARALGQRVRIIRALTGLTSEQLERLAGLERGTVDGIERGTVDASASDLAEIADVMGVTLDFMLFVTDADPYEYFDGRIRELREWRSGAPERTVPVYDPNDPDDVACMLDIALERAGVPVDESRRLIDTLDG